MVGGAELPWFDSSKMHFDYDTVGLEDHRHFYDDDGNEHDNALHHENEIQTDHIGEGLGSDKQKKRICKNPLFYYYSF